MSVNGTDNELRAKHDELHERLTLLADNPELNETQRGLAQSWRSRIEFFEAGTTSPLSVAFLAAVGRGKSALIAAATGLRLDTPGTQNLKRSSVVPVGDGRTTLGEIRIEFEDRNDIALDVEPMKSRELTTEIRIFAQDRHNSSRKVKNSTDDDRKSGEELATLLRNWLTSTNATDNGNDLLRRQALAAESVETLETQWLERIDLNARCLPFAQRFVVDQAGRALLKNTLGDLMKGTLPNAPVPVLTRIKVPRTNLGKEVSTIVDTQGIDDAPNAWVKGRADLLQWIHDPNTLLMACSSWNDAPDHVSQSLLQTIQEHVGIEGLRQRAVRLVLVDNRDKNGEPDEELEQDKRLRIQQCQDKLRQAGIEFPDDAVLAIDVRESEEAIQRAIVDMARETRKLRVEAWQQVLQDAEEATAALTDETFAARTRLLDLRLWWAWDAEMVRNQGDTIDHFQYLARDMKKFCSDATQLDAAVRRRGRYQKFDLAGFGGSIVGCALDNKYFQGWQAVTAAIADFAPNADDALANHLLMRTFHFDKAIREYEESLIEHHAGLLRTYFASPRSDDLWQSCRNLWGQGDGYVQKVANRFREESSRVNLNIPYHDSIEQRLPERPDLFRLRKIRLKNFRGVEDSTHELQNITVFIGDNGLGKTSWLEALAATIGTFLPGVGAGAAPMLENGDVRQTMRLLGGIPDRQRQLPMQIGVEGIIEGYPLTWSRQVTELPITKAIAIDDALQSKARKAGEEIRAHSMRQLPVLAYYGTQRLWPADIEATSDVGSNRLDGYRDCLKAASTHQHLLNWMRKFTYAEIQNKKPIVQLQGIQRAVLACIEGAKKFSFQIGIEELVLEMEDGQCPTFRMLSDGYRNMVAMTADIAWRASVLNPHLLDRAPELAEGVVLIDEIDLHLHPKWQRRVLASLRRAFPRLQFITTTHSPFIVQSLEDGQLVNLDERADAGPYANESPEDIVERHMGVAVPQRSDRREREYEVAQRYYDMLERVPHVDAVELSKLKAELDELLAPYADNQAFVAFLDRQRQLTEAKKS